MADYHIGALIAGTGGIQPPKFDFQNAIGNLPNAYWEGLEQAYKQRNRDVFQNGIPNDPQQMIRDVARVQGAGAAPQVMDYYRLLYGANADAQDNPMPGAPPPQRQALPPPSTSNGVTGPVPRANDMTGIRTDNMEIDPGTVAQANGLPPPQPMAPTQVRTVQYPTPNDAVAARFPSNPAAPLSPSAAPQADPTLGGLIPVGRTAEQHVAGLNQRINSGMLPKHMVEDYQKKIDAINKARDQYREEGIKHNNRITEKTIEPVIEALRDERKVAKTSSDSIDVSKEMLAQLNSKSGMFSGQWADNKLSLAKMARVFGVEVSDPNKINRTETFRAIGGRLTGAVAKMFGSGAGITEKDVQMAEGIAAGRIALDETSIREILKINAKLDRAKILNHNRAVDEFVKQNPEAQRVKSSMRVNSDLGIDPRAVAKLRKTPNLKADFDEMYGRGAADHVLGR